MANQNLVIFQAKHAGLYAGWWKYYFDQWRVEYKLPTGSLFTETTPNFYFPDLKMWGLADRVGCDQLLRETGLPVVSLGYLPWQVKTLLVHQPDGARAIEIAPRKLFKSRAQQFADKARAI